MKRALSVALVLAASFVAQGAFAQDATPPAAPPAAPAAPPAPADPTAAPPADPAANPTAGTGGLTLGGPKKDAPADPKKKEEKKPKPNLFAGSSLFTQFTTGTTTFFPSQQNYRGATTDVSMFFLPRYALSKNFQLRGRTVFNYEFTDTANTGTATSNEPRFSDTSLSLFYRGIPAFKGFKPNVAINLGLPTSPESRARTVVVSPGITFQLAKAIEKPGPLDEIDFLAFATYSHPIYTHTTPGVRGDFPYQRPCGGGSASVGDSTCGSQLSGVANASDIFTWTALVSATWWKFAPAVLFNMSHQFAYTFNKDQIQNGASTVTASRDSTRQTVRNSTYFAFWLDYEANSWLTPELGYYMIRRLIRDDGSYGNPFFDSNQDMRVYLGANIALDNLAKAIAGEGGDAGIVRAKNKTGPALGSF